MHGVTSIKVKAVVAFSTRTEGRAWYAATKTKNDARVANGVRGLLATAVGALKRWWNLWMAL